MPTGIIDVITSAIKAVSPSGVATFFSVDKFDNGNVVDFMKSAIDPTKTVKNMNLEVQASKSIAYYPVFFTNSVNQATAGVITKMLERRIAEMIRLIISRNDYIDMTKANSKEEVIRQFRGAVFGSDDTSAKSSAYGRIANMTESSGVEIAMYIRDNHTKLIEAATIPLENLFESELLNFSNTTTNMALTEAPQHYYNKDQVEQIVKDMDGKLKDKYNREKLDEIARIKTQLKNKKEIDKRGIVMDNKKITKLNDNEPTIMEVDVVYGNEGSMKTTTILLAVKCTIHVYNSEDFCKEIANTLYTERAGFRAIQLFTGEISFWSDFVFAVDKIKPYYVNERSSAASMFARLTQTARTGKRLNINNKTQSTFIPTTTIVLTLDEVENIKRICQENIMSSDIALKFINLTGIMNLLVVEEATGVLYRFDHSTKQFDKTSIPMEDQENKKSDNLIKALSMALVHR